MLLCSSSILPNTPSFYSTARISLSTELSHTEIIFPAKYMFWELYLGGRTPCKMVFHVISQQLKNENFSCWILKNVKSIRQKRDPRWSVAEGVNVCSQGVLQSAGSSSLGWKPCRPGASSSVSSFFSPGFLGSVDISPLAYKNSVRVELGNLNVMLIHKLLT